MKRTTKNCSIIKKYSKIDQWYPRINESGCEGYADEDEEPFDICLRCNLFFQEEQDGD